MDPNFNTTLPNSDEEYGSQIVWDKYLIIEDMKHITPLTRVSFITLYRVYEGVLISP
jgi:hypothetical protein